MSSFISSIPLSTRTARVCTLMALLSPAAFAEAVPYGPVCFLHRRPPFRARKRVLTAARRTRHSLDLPRPFDTSRDVCCSHFHSPAGCTRRVRYRQNPFFPRGRSGTTIIVFNQLDLFLINLGRQVAPSWSRRPPREVILELKFNCNFRVKEKSLLEEALLTSILLPGAEEYLLALGYE